MLASQFHRTLPPIQRGPYPMPPLFSVVVPIARTNLVTNPSVETATTNWTGSGASIARSTTQQYHGAYSLAVTPTAATGDGVFYGPISLTAGQLYAVSCKFLGIAGVPYKFTVTTTGGAELTTIKVRGTGRWQWIYLYHMETASTTRRIYLVKDNSTSTGVFYVDGLQCEAINAGETVSSYLDGDQQGLVPNQSPPAYGWNGVPHASTSYRSGQTRAGGMVMRLDYFGFVLLTIAGLGAVTPTNIAQNYVQLDGAAYERTSKGPRQFTLGGRFDAATFPQLQRQISDLTAVLDRDYVAQQQPLTLLYQGVDDCNRVTSDTGRIICSYQGGLEGVTDNQHAEQTSVVFRQWLPTILSDGEAGISLTTQSNIANANYIIQRSPAGIWSAMSTGMNGQVNAILAARDGTWYVGGAFTTAGGTTVNRIARWDGSTWTALTATPGVNGTVYALTEAANGDIIVGGAFTTAGGVTVNGVTRWNGTVFAALGGTPGIAGGGATVYAVKYDANANLIVTGDFTSAGGAGAAGIAVWNGASWSPFGSGLGGGTATGFALTVGNDGYLVVGGDFTTANGVTVNRIAKWTGSTFTALSSGMSGVVYALLVMPNGTLIAGGDFVTAGGITVNEIASWNGVTWSPFSTGMNFLVRALAYDPLNPAGFYAGGLFSTAGGISLPAHVARWTGGAWTYPDVTLPTSPTVFGIGTRPDGTIILGFGTSGTATASTNTATNTGTAKAYPTLTIKGPSSGSARVFNLTNYANNRVLFFNYTIQAGETATFVFDPAYLSFTSDIQGNLHSKLLSGSTDADFFLQPGANVVSLYTADATVTATLVWRPGYVSYHDLTP